MALTGRAALIAAIATITTLILRTVPGLIAVDSLIAVAIIADIALAGSARQLHMSRSGDTRIMLGQRGAITLGIANPGRRQVRGLLRDAWQPSVHASGRAAIAVPSGGRVAVTTTVEPTRRGDKTAGKVTVRSVGPLGLAARQASRDVPWTIRVLPPFLSRKHLPEKLASLRQLAAGAIRAP